MTDKPAYNGSHIDALQDLWHAIRMRLFHSINHKETIQRPEHWHVLYKLEHALHLLAPMEVTLVGLNIVEH